jgi:hypothetical protein
MITVQELENSLYLVNVLFSCSLSPVEFSQPPDTRIHTFSFDLRSPAHCTFSRPSGLISHFLVQPSVPCRHLSALFTVFVLHFLLFLKYYITFYTLY